jgi:hypothetical protein
MSLFRDALRPEPIASDEALRRYIASIRAHLEPDPLFRRRLRGTVLNRFVAQREGKIATRRGARAAMGRLGRACLYTSVALAMSAGVTMAASQAALPGDPLYPLKLRIEALRVLALPDFHDALAVYALSERIHELGMLAERGAWAQVESLAGPIREEYAALAAAGIDPGQADGALSPRLAVLDALLERLPPRAQEAIADAMAGAPGLLEAPAQPVEGGSHPGKGQPSAGGANNDGTNANGGTNNGGANNDGTHDPGRKGSGGDGGGGSGNKGSSTGPGG